MPELWERHEFIDNIDSVTPNYPAQKKEYVRRGIAGTPVDAFGRIVDARVQTSDPELLRGVLVSFYRTARVDAHYLDVSVSDIAHAISRRNDELYANYDSASTNE